MKASHYLSSHVLLLSFSSAGANSDATGRLGHSTEQKVAAALRVQLYAEAFDQSDHVLRMSEESIQQFFLRPTRHLTGKYFKEIVRLPTNDEVIAVSDRFERMLCETRTRVPNLTSIISCS
jgi:anion-transporting  ArsA/GET3 family ATPase